MLQYSQAKNSSFLVEQGFENSLSVDKLLGHEPGSGKHSEATVLEFLRLHSYELGWVLGLQSKRVKADVSRDVRVTEKSRLGDGDVLGLDPSDFGTLRLGLGNSSSQNYPEDGVYLSEVSDGGSGNLAVEEDGGSFDSFSNKETNNGKHGNTSMGKLCFTVPLQGGFIGLGCETERVEETNRVKGSWDGVGSESSEAGTGALAGRGSKGGGRSGKKGEGGGELHRCC
mmetsp:Transcript_5725/g.8100  ORF Transcript_5725/g.8100 Transcript_5725/m.8100 type:complete len:227 (-) Transcript_5725:49-729(-)